MKTIIKKTTENDAFSMASDILRNGGLVAFPTETVYGLGGNALDPRASEKIYAAKGRPSDNPLIVHIANRADVAELASEIPPIAEKLMDRFWPGPHLCRIGGRIYGYNIQQNCMWGDTELQMR